MKDPFELLDVFNNASDEEVRLAYLKKVKEYTPEHAPERFQEIRAAFELIKDKKQRLRYELFNQELPEITPLLERGLKSGVSSRPTENDFLQLLASCLKT